LIGIWGIKESVSRDEFKAFCQPDFDADRHVPEKVSAPVLWDLVPSKVQAWVFSSF